jgi:hypothetical protein
LGVTALGDENRSRELPQRVRGTARAGPAPPAQPVLSEELRQRIRAAVRAERGEAVGQDQELASEPERPATASAPRRTKAASPVTNGVDRAIESERAAAPVKSMRAAEHVAPERTATRVKSGRTVQPAAPERTAETAAPEGTAAPVKSEQAVKSVQLVKRKPTAKPQPADIAPVDHKPVAVPQTDRPERPPEDKPVQPVRRRFATARLVGWALAVIAVASLAAAVTKYVTSSPASIQAPSAALERQEVALGKQAATWVAQQVSHDVMVSCDRMVCTALEADGFPSRELLVLGSASSYPRTSAVVVETAAVLDLFGSSLNTYAPAVLATFGSGDAQVTIRVIAPNGATAYYNALSADLSARKASEADLLQINVITLSPTARKQLIAGQVDSRLVLAIAALATKEPIEIVQFGNIGPGADADLPLRYADLAQNDPAAHLAGSAYVRSLRTDLGAGPAAYRPASTPTVVLPGDQPGLRIEFSAPSPLGLLSPQETH